jgi:putative protease
MPKKAKGKSKKKKPAPRKAVKKAVKKKALRKKVTAKKKRAKKKVAKKKALKKKAVKKAVKKKAAAKARPARKQAAPAKPPLVTPGPPSGSIPPVEEPAPNEVAAGVVTHYYSHLGVAVIQVNKGEIKTGDTIHIKGHTTDFTQQVESMEYEHQHLDVATAGRSVGLKVKDHVREHDIVYLVK